MTIETNGSSPITLRYSRNTPGDLLRLDFTQIMFCRGANLFRYGLIGFFCLYQRLLLMRERRRPTQYHSEASGAAILPW